MTIVIMLSVAAYLVWRLAFKKCFDAVDKAIRDAEESAGR